MKIIIFLKIIIGSIFLILGTIGIILPLLPTTPFILLSIACFSSTPKIRNKLLRIKFIKEYYNSYHLGQGLKKKTVIISLVFLWCALSISAIITQKIWIGFLLLVVGLLVTLHILHIAKGEPAMKIPKLIEILFDTAYLFTVMIIGLFLLIKTDSYISTLYGVMALVLLIGDAFHLIPRILSALTNANNKFQKLMGIGKMFTSITMTVFYVLLWHIGLIYYSINSPVFTVIVYIISVIRILFCLLPGNKWLTNDATLKWSIYRNVPFLILGIMVLVLYLFNNINSSIFNYMWIAITLSFLFYIPVTLFSKKYPKIGMLMLPKSCAYIWILIMGLSLI